MQVTTIFGKEFTTIASLKAFAVEQGINIKGSSKWVKQQWIETIETYMEVQSEVIATVVDAELAAAKASEQIETTVVSIGSLIVAALTSESAVNAYRTIRPG